uniref:(northern house mosquito) hypothetical protein n=1 Tax=Culex pipiens TaxID=7175 RepID=A0A8D8I2L2_CULPI
MLEAITVRRAAKQYRIAGICRVGSRAAGLSFVRITGVITTKAVRTAVGVVPLMMVVGFTLECQRKRLPATVQMRRGTRWTVVSTSPVMTSKRRSLVVIVVAEISVGRVTVPVIIGTVPRVVPPSTAAVVLVEPPFTVISTGSIVGHTVPWRGRTHSSHRVRGSAVSHHPGRVRVAKVVTCHRVAVVVHVAGAATAPFHCEFGFAKALATQPMARTVGLIGQ